MPDLERPSRVWLWISSVPLTLPAALQAARCESQVVSSDPGAAAVPPDVVVYDAEDPRAVARVAEWTARGPTQAVRLRESDAPAPAPAEHTWDATSAELVGVVQRAAQQARLRSEVQRLRARLAHRAGRDLVGGSSALQGVRERLASLAQRRGPVWISGERGTGKKLAARTLHDLSDVAHRPFLVLDVRALQAGALELELFGGPGVVGRLDLARGGTILFDHLSEMPRPLQRRLAATFGPASGSNVEPPRWLATSRVPLPELLKQRLIEPDLAPLFEPVGLALPPLRARPEDLAPLCEHFLTRIANRTGGLPRRLPLDVLQLLQTHDWPDNVRELEQLLERVCQLDNSTRLSAELIAPWLTSPSDVPVDPEGLSLAAMERRLIEATFNRYRGNREQTARVLQIGVRTLSGKLREYGYPPRGGPGSNQTTAAEPYAA